MAEYEATREMPATSATVFEVASDVGLVNQWLPHGLIVRDSGAGTVEAAGDVVPGGGEHEGLFGASADQLRVEWGGRDHPGYAGWLQVSDRGDDASEVTVHISLLDEPEEQTSQERRSEVRAMLDESLDRLAGEVARRA
ncbi:MULTISPECIES: SRPBCC family protein [unclassified Nonomuraea]|uniref:SRPBCC family protein n=1 Tax=unclassified Nonomuraea TaxID=2593643 RepID=UPI0033FD0FCC